MDATRNGDAGPVVQRCRNFARHGGVPPADEHRGHGATRVAFCGDNLEQLAKLPDACVDFVDCLPRVLRSIRQITPLTARQIRINVVQQKKRPALFQSPPERARLAPFLRRDAKAVLEIF